MPLVTKKILRGFDRAAYVQAREASGYSIGDLARIAKVNLTSLYEWERGTTTPQVDTLARVAKVMDVPMNRIVRIRPKDRMLSDLRVLAGLTQPELGKAAGFSTTSIGNIERAEVRLTEKKAEALAKSLGVGVSAVRAGYRNAERRLPGTPA